MNDGRVRFMRLEGANDLTRPHELFAENRWLEFTDAELDAVYEGLGQIANKTGDQMYPEVEADMRRRGWSDDQGRGWWEAKR